MWASSRALPLHPISTLYRIRHGIRLLTGTRMTILPGDAFIVLYVRRCTIAGGSLFDQAPEQAGALQVEAPLQGLADYLSESTFGRVNRVPAAVADRPGRQRPRECRVRGYLPVVQHKRGPGGTSTKDQDTDDDTQSDLEEVLVGTDGTDSNSFFAIASIIVTSPAVLWYDTVTGHVPAWSSMRTCLPHHSRGPSSATPSQERVSRRW